MNKANISAFSLAILVAACGGGGEAEQTSTGSDKGDSITTPSPAPQPDPISPAPAPAPSPEPVEPAPAPSPQPAPAPAPEQGPTPAPAPIPEPSPSPEPAPAPPPAAIQLPSQFYSAQLECAQGNPLGRIGQPIAITFNSGTLQIVGNPRTPYQVSAVSAWELERYGSHSVYSANADQGRRIWLTIDGGNQMVSAGVNNYSGADTMYCGESLYQQSIKPFYPDASNRFGWRTGSIDLVCTSETRQAGSVIDGPTSSSGQANMTEFGEGQVITNGESFAIPRVSTADNTQGASYRRTLSCDNIGCQAYWYENPNAPRTVTVTTRPDMSLRRLLFTRSKGSYSETTSCEPQ